MTLSASYLSFYGHNTFPIITQIFIVASLLSKGSDFIFKYYLYVLTIIANKKETYRLNNGQIFFAELAPFV